MEARFSLSERLIALVFFIVLNLGVLVVYLFDPYKWQVFPKCWFYHLTGFACPGCGLTRGLHALLHGDFFKAIDYNAMLPLYLLAFFYFYLSLLLVIIMGRWFNAFSAKKLYYLTLAFLVVNLAFGLLRNLPFPPFHYLYP